MGKWGRTLANLVDRLHSAYSGQRVLVTGHNGFKGSWLVALLNYFGAEVVGVSLEIENYSPFKNFHASGTHKSIVQDIRDFNGLQKLVSDLNPDLVFHLAAQPLVLKSYEIPRETFETNVQGTANLLSALSGPNLRGVVIATTDKVYQNDESGREFKEQDQLWGHDPYALSKTGTELVVDAWRGLPAKSARQLITVRAGNVFGPGDRAPDRLVPDLIRCIENSSVLEVRNPNSIRPWQYVLDPLLGYVMVGNQILDSKGISHSYNFGPQEGTFLSVSQFLNQIQKLISFDINIKQTNTNLESEILKLDSSLATRELGWKSVTNISAGINYLLKIDKPSITTPTIMEHVHEYINELADYEVPS
jgi:CDP-glucose 4,6-dehydratase